MNDKDKDLDDVLQHLKSVVEDGYKKYNRPLAAAGLKPALQSRLGHFNENDHGYSSFRDFLRMAEQKGLIQLTRGDIDLMALPVSHDSSGPLTAFPAIKDDLSTIRSIAAPFFNAFLKVVPGKVVYRVYDKENQTAHIIPKEKSLNEPAEIEGLRQLFQEHSDRFISIEAVRDEDKLRWAKSFLNECVPSSHKSKDGLLNLVDANNFGSFVNALRTDNYLWLKWQDHQAIKLFEHITYWARDKHEVKLPTDIVRVVPAEVVFRKRTSGSSPKVSEKNKTKLGRSQVSTQLIDDSDNSIREFAKECIERMDIDDVLEIMIPIKLLVGRD